MKHNRCSYIKKVLYHLSYFAVILELQCIKKNLNSNVRYIIPWQQECIKSSERIKITEVKKNVLIFFSYHSVDSRFFLQNCLIL